jgi:hypothetical protein
VEVEVEYMHWISSRIAAGVEEVVVEQESM